MADLPRLILASGSRFRRHMLEAAGLSFSVEPATIDERAVEQLLVNRREGVGASEVATALAIEKAKAVSSEHPDALVIGCDQVLAFENALISKPESILAARQQLLRLRGRVHTLHSGIALVSRGEVAWSHVEIARMSMRMFSEAWLDDYVARMGERLCQTVGGYEIEAEGIQLFDAIDGDHFTIIGLPLLPLLAKLRELGAIAA